MIGMLWQGEAKDLAKDLAAAVEYFRHKYGRAPIFALAAVTAEQEIGGLTVKPDKTTPRNHVMLVMSQGERKGNNGHN